MMNKQDTASVLAVLSSGFPNVKLTKETAMVYHEVLVDLEPKDVMIAVGRLLKTAEWFPPAALIRRTTMELTGCLAKSASHAWGEVSEGIRIHGYYQCPPFESKLVQEAVRRIGWRTICYSDKPEFIRSQFVKVYDELREIHDLSVLVGETSKELSSEKVKAIEANSTEEQAQNRPRMVKSQENSY